MSRSSLNAIVDAAAFAAFVFLAATGAVIRYVLPPGTGHFSTLWGMDRHEWGNVHFWIAVALMVAIAIHVYLHWAWVVAVVKGCGEKSGARVASSLVALLIVLAIAAAPLLGRVENSGEPLHKTRSDQRPKASSAASINGSMTLSEIERQTGVSAAAIAKELGLPHDVSADERLGRLRQQYGFEMHDVRSIVEKHQSGKTDPPE